MRFRLTLIVIIALGFLVTGCPIKRAPQPDMSPPPDSKPEPVAPETAPAPELQIIKVSGVGGGRSDAFQVKILWTGDEPITWTADRWLFMIDRTGQTQSMLVVDEQTFEVRPGEPRTLQVKAIPLDSTKPPARNLIVDYDDMPEYELTRQIPDPRIEKFITAVAKAEKDLQQLVQKVSFEGSSIVYSPEDRDFIEPYLDVVLWDLGGDKPTPYIPKRVIRASLTLILSGQSAMSFKDFKALMQRSAIPVGDNQDIRALRARVNSFLKMTGFEIKIEKG